MSGARTDGPGSEPRRPWRGRRVLLGVTGGIAAYKVVHVARELTRRGATVDVVMTRSAQAFVGPVSFEGVTGRPVSTELVAPGSALDHIRLARAADVVCVAPATADFMARAAGGQSGDLLTAVLLATRAPVLLCPAMNDRMWSHPQTARNADHLRELGYEIIGPDDGPLAYGEGEGPGRLVEPEAIVEWIGRALEADTAFRGRTIVVTAGPTREDMDPIRFLSNRSSGRMGYALAAAAWRRGATVRLVSGPTEVATPVGPELIRVESAEAMRDAVHEALPGADALIMAAAVADFRPAERAEGKIKRRAGVPGPIELSSAPDILASIQEIKPEGLAVVGFALETDDAHENAREKLAAKGLDLIVLNEAGKPGAGFEVDTNEVFIIDRSGTEEALPRLSKDAVAERILDQLERWLPTR